MDDTATVLVTEPEYRKGRAAFDATDDLTIVSAPANEQSLAAWVRKTPCRAVIVGAMPYTGALYEALGEVARAGGALLARFGVEHDGIDMGLACRHEITVTNTPGALDASVAELTMTLLGMLARRVAALDAALRQGDCCPAEPGCELAGKTLVVLGLGGIGRRVAAMAHHGFAMRVIGVGRREGADLAASLGLPPGEYCAALGLADYTPDVDAALAEADAVTLHLPATKQTVGILGAKRLAGLRRGAMLVNTACESLIDEGALYDALAAGQLAGAALDVFGRTPYKPAVRGKDLRTLSRVVLTPHIGPQTAEANLRMARQSLDNARRFLRGERKDLDVVHG